MGEPDTGTSRTGGMNIWRAGCSGSCTSGSEGGPEKPTSRKTVRALRSAPYEDVLIYRITTTGAGVGVELWFDGYG
jgi:hypothetical protein